MLKEIIALIATMLVVGSYLPQIFKAYKTKRLDDVSMGFLVMICFGVLLWLIYGILNNDVTFVIANAIIILCSGTLIVMKLKYKS